MNTKRYSFPSEKIANELIYLLSNESLPEEELVNYRVKPVTESTHGIACLGFQDKYIFNKETQENELEHKGLSYNVDIVWKDEKVDTGEIDEETGLPIYEEVSKEPEEWKDFKVTPITPNHSFAIFKNNKTVLL